MNLDLKQPQQSFKDPTAGKTAKEPPARHQRIIDRRLQCCRLFCLAFHHLWSTPTKVTTTTMLSLRSASLLSRRRIAPFGSAAARLASTLVVSDPLVDTVTPPGTLAAVSAAQKLHDGPISLLVVSEAPPTKIPAGVSKVFHVACNDKLSETVASAMQKAQEGNSFTHILAPSSKFGSTVVPRAAALLNVAPVTDVLDIIEIGVLLCFAERVSLYSSTISLCYYTIMQIRT